MGKRLLVLFLLTLVVSCIFVATAEDEEGWPGGEEGGSGRREGEGSFLLRNSQRVVKTEAGDMRVVRGVSGKAVKSPLHIGFITMEPKSLFVPQYLDSSIIIFVRRGGATVGHIYKDELVERNLTVGDIYRIQAGSAFYLMNTAEGQRLHIICSIDTTESLGLQTFQSFFVAGGTYPRSVLSGFDLLTLSTAFNVSESEVSEMLTRQQHGPIVFLTESHAPSVLAKFMRRTMIRNNAPQEDKEEEKKWSFRKMLNSVFGITNRSESNRKSKTGKGPDSYNIYDRKPDFSNNYGSSIALDDSDYEPLRDDDIGIYLVNLTAGSMMAPHINPRATEYGVVLNGAGTIQIVFPNGTLAMNAKVTEGDVFWIPRYFPFCQIASRSGPFEFFGFSTSARNNRPQFLVGANSLLQTMRGPVLAAAFGVSEERLNQFIDAQNETTILPSATVSPPGEVAMKMELERSRIVAKVISNVDNVVW